MSEPIVYIDRSDVREGKLEEVKAAIKGLVAFVEEHNQRIIDYRFFIDDAADRMTLVAIHPDPAALEFHLDVGAAEFRKMTDLIELRSIEVFGTPGERVMEQLRQKAEMLGEGGSVTVHAASTGFTRSGRQARSRR
jgi:hypothetical protein